MKIPLSSLGLKLSKSKRDCRVSQLFSSLSNRFHQWLSDMELSQIRAFFQLLFSTINPYFTASKQYLGLILSRKSLTAEYDHVHIHSLWSMLFKSSIRRLKWCAICEMRTRQGYILYTCELHSDFARKMKIIKNPSPSAFFSAYSNSMASLSSLKYSSKAD